MAVPLDSAARSLLRRQRGLLARWQARRVGVSPRVLHREASRGELCRWVGERTVVFGAGELDLGQNRILACLEAGGTASLGGIAALQEAGWSGEAPDRIDIVVPRNYSAAKRGLSHSVRLHYVQSPPTVLRSVRCTTPARSMVDAVAWARSEREAAFLVLSALQSGVVSGQDVAAELNGNPRVHRARLARELLGEFAHGVTTMGELDFVRGCRIRGLPEPRMQVRQTDAAGRARIVDAEFVTPDGRRVMVEIDGTGHRTESTWRSDMVRHNDLALTTGALVLRVTNSQLRHEPEVIYSRLTAALEGRGL